MTVGLRSRGSADREAAVHLARVRVADEGVLARLEGDVERLLALGRDVRRDVDAARAGEVEVVLGRLVVDDDRVVAGGEPVGAVEADLEAGADAAVQGRRAAAGRVAAGVAAPPRWSRRRPLLVVVIAAAAGEDEAEHEQQDREA